ncbi:uncharacterized protein LOC131940565 [Physella acuta]|uniref:uncharacterized protein LOC131940565 n=1 Tax=Physella acuta TaxID=109671 RepID=UPI0027DE5E4D|nr:uncharacterized protein LOC131940565 [Physella acuta]
MADELHVDISKLAKDYFDSLLDAEQKRLADRKHPVLNWSNMIVTFGPTRYTKKKMEPNEDVNILFSANFENTSMKAKKFMLKTERESLSINEIAMTKTYTYSGDIELNIEVPEELAKVNATFNSELKTEKGKRIMYEERLMWGVDTNIVVQPGFTVRAELAVKEASFNGEFEMNVTFDGEIFISYVHKKDKEVLETFHECVTKIFTPCSGFTIDSNGKPMLTVKGHCKSRFGIEQIINLTEFMTPLFQAFDD